MVLKTLGQKVKGLVGEDRGVSPVIGVILMVAITVILAAVIGTFVLGLGDDLGESAPNATFSSGEDVGTTTVTFTHTGGESMSGEHVYIVYDGVRLQDGEAVHADVTGVSIPSEVGSGVQLSITFAPDTTNDLEGNFISIAFDDETNSLTYTTHDISDEMIAAAGSA